MRSFRRLTLMFLASAGCGWGDPVREWTSVDGKKITAEYLGVQGGDVVLKLAGGKISNVPVAKLSPEDNAFIKDNRVEYRAAWQAWPTDADYTMQNVPIQEAPADGGTFIYTTPHFRFRSDANLGTTLMKDLARVFELTYYVHTKSPFGVLAKPDDGLFNARLFGTTAEYSAAGGPPHTAGVYQLKDKVFLAPLDMMGIRPGSAGWRKDRDYDPSTVIHELTHMLTHEMLNNLPVWLNEGYAEYISHIPIEKGAFKTSRDKIREGVLDRFIREQERQTTGESPRAIGIGERIKYQKSGVSPKLYRVEKVLGMTDEEWLTGRVGAAPSPIPGPTFTPPSPFGQREPDDRLPTLYRTAHLIVYYFIQIEGEAGVTKIRRFLDENRKYMASYLEYVDSYKKFEGEMAVFMMLPGVTKLPDGRVQYPSALKPPHAPKVPFSDPNQLKLGGLDGLLGGESATVVGARIENALRQDLGVKLRFE